uniref:Retrovirus-related Pol polyprotein from transposon TNT 1-94-like beta-barrel domain-containing protein n=1 Tax=Chenopodium quinoa TaxID=63459 RepID=A0A803MDU7_CHEQI
MSEGFSCMYLWCSCILYLSVSKELANLEAEDKLMKFLLRLNSGFDSTITNILAMDPLPTINKAFSIAQQIEKQKERNFSKGNNTQNFMKDWRKEKYDRKCDHCKGKGHTIDSCFELHGNPEWYNTLKASKPAGLENGTSAISGVDSDMLSLICQEVMKTMKGKQNSKGAGMSCANFAGTDTYSLNCSVNTGSSCLWIIDSGACDHMIYDRSLFVNEKKLGRPVRVCLPDGSFKYVDLVGSVCLSDKLILHDVMLVEGFKHNLLSIGKLLDQTGVKVFFTRNGCCFQVLSSEEVIGHGLRQNGLYYFSTDEVINVADNNAILGCNNVDNNTSAGHGFSLLDKTSTSMSNKGRNGVGIDLLHARLGHVSLSKMKHVSGIDCSDSANSALSNSEHVSAHSHIPTVVPIEQDNLRRSSRPVKPSSKYQDFETTYIPHRDVTSEYSESFAVNSCKIIEPDAGMEECISVATPMSTGLKLFLEDGDLLSEPDTYKRLVGRLLYLGITRPDLSYAVQHLSQFMHAPRITHLRAALHVIKYLKGTVDSGLWYSANSTLDLQGYSDADWGGCQFSSRSLSAYAIFLGSNLVSWKTKKQRSVSKSSTESEYRSMPVTSSELEWVYGLLEDLQVKIHTAQFVMFQAWTVG